MSYKYEEHPMIMQGMCLLRLTVYYWLKDPDLVKVHTHTYIF